MTIIIRVKDQSLRAPANLPDIISGSQEFVKFQFVLENDWDGLTTFAQFRQNERAYNQYLDFENCVYLPAEIEQGIVTLMLYGTGNNTIATTNYLTLSVNQHHLVSDAQSTAISQSLYAQLVAQVNQLEGIISGSVSGGDGGSSGGSDGGSAGAAAINTHNTSATAHDARFAGKVDKIEGKGLSTNDYTNAEKTKLAEIAANANNYTHPTTHSASMITGLASVEAITGGQRLTINDADGAHVLDILASTGGGSGDNEQPIDDDVISSANPWSSEKIVDTLCPPFEISGNPVTCYPVAGSQLRVKASVEPALRLDWLSREGETTQDGVPSADEPIPLVDSVPAGSYYVPSTASGGGYWRVDLSEALGGVDTYNDAIEIDAFTGRWQIVRRTYLLTLNGTQNITYSGTFFSYSSAIRAVGDTGICNRYRRLVPPIAGSDDICFIMSPSVMHFRDSRFNSAELYKLHMFAEPIVVRYAVETPIITTGQATHVTSTTGLTALNATSMGLTAPDPDHPCAITVAESVHITHNDDVYDITLSNGFAGGEVDVTGGTVTGEWGKIVLDGGRTYTRHLHSNGMPYIEVNGVSTLHTTGENSGTLFSSHHKQTAWTTVSGRIYSPDGTVIIIVDKRFTDSAAIQAIYAANPETIYYKRTTPVQQSVAPTPITALPDCNTIMTDAQSLTVSGRADPIHIIDDMAQRLSALENAVVNE